MTGSGTGGGALPSERRMSVVHLQLQADHAEVMFVESARVYRLARSNAQYGSTLSALRAALADRRPLSVVFETADGEVIESAHRDRAR